VRGLGAGMTAVFVLSAAVQWNDPDPYGWIGFYLLAGVSALGLALGRAWRVVEFLALVASALVVVALLPSLETARVEAFTSFKMRSSDDELVRELVGAAVALVWTSGLVWRRQRARRAARTA